MEEETIFENWNDDTESSNFMTQEALDVENRANSPLRDTTLENMEESEGIDEPYVGKEFKCLDDAMKYYNSYALITGFGIRKGSSYKSKKLCIVTAQAFTCSNEGWPKNKQKEVMIGEGAHKDRTPQKESSSMRTGCKASMRVRMEDDNKWVVTSFFRGHNHVLLPSPSKARFFRCRRKIGEEEKALIQTLHEQNIPPKQIMDVIASQNGGIRNVSFTRKDLSNHTTRLRRSLFDIDISTTVNYFQQLQAANPMFYYAIQIDLDNTARNIFWVDGKSRMAYQYFGDVVTFDTTYMTNKYDMPFAPFIGVNHYGQTILFGCALIKDETSESFAWLFRTWIAAMFGRHPKSILTDYFEFFLYCN